MKLLKNDSASAEIAISFNELLTLHQSLNEICNGIEIFEFQTHLGATREEALLLMETLDLIISKMETFGKENLRNENDI
jgi:hypothetical protein